MHEKFKKIFNSQIFFSSHHSARRGVIIMIRNHIHFEVETTISDKEGRYVLVVGKIEGEYFTLLNVYNPPEDGPSTIERIMDLIMVQNKGITVLGSDLNLLMNEKLDSQGNVKHKALKDARLMRAFEKDIGIADVWRTFNPTKRNYTYFSPVTGNYSRFDYFFYVC